MRVSFPGLGWADTHLSRARCRGLLSWQLYNAPIKASFCDDWYTACADDYFCATDGGSYFSCAAAYEECDNSVLNQESGSTDGVDTRVVVAVVVPAVLVALLAVGAVFFMCTREKQGRPVFHQQINTNPTFNPKADPVYLQEVTGETVPTQQSTV